MEEKEVKTEEGRFDRYCHHRRFMLARVLIGILLLGVVFLAGIKVGEIKSYFGPRYGGYGMMRWNDGFPGGRMMGPGYYGYGYYQQQPVNQGTSTVK